MIFFLFLISKIEQNRKIYKVAEVITGIMKFCPECDNILIPKNKKLYCKACEKEFELNPKTDEYKIVKTIRHDEKETAPIIIKETLREERISDQDRKAYEDLFDLSEADY